jgi:hypothetical protein
MPCGSRCRHTSCPPAQPLLWRGLV